MIKNWHALGWVITAVVAVSLALTSFWSPVSLTAEAATSTSPSYLYVVTSSGGTITEEDGTFAISLADTSDHVTYFSDRPERDAGVIDAATFTDEVFDFGATPNAALVTTIDGKSYTFVIDMDRPIWDGTTMRFHATPVGDVPEALSDLVSESSPLAEASLGASELFVDSASTECRIQVRTEVDLTLERFSPSASHHWLNHNTPRSLSAGDKPTWHAKTESDGHVHAVIVYTWHGERNSQTMTLEVKCEQGNPPTLHEVKCKYEQSDSPISGEIGPNCFGDKDAPLLETPTASFWIQKVDPQPPANDDSEADQDGSPPVGSDSAEDDDDGDGEGDPDDDDDDDGE